MIDTDTIMKLRAMRISGMASALEDIDDLDSGRKFSTGEIIKIAVDREWEQRQNSKLFRLRKAAKLAQPAADIHNLAVSKNRKINIDLIRQLAVGNYILKHQDVILQGPTGSGKTYVACALGNKAIQQYKNVMYLRAAELFDLFTLANRAAETGKLLERLTKIELLIIDDWFLTPPSKEQVQQLHLLIDRRYQHASTVFCSQLPPDQWHNRMDEKILADAIIDRITTNAMTITLDCQESLRRHFNKH